MIALVTGVPGSGKSYFMVNYLSKFFTYDVFYKSFNVTDNVLIISNIENLQIPHLKLDSADLIGNYSEGIEGKYTVEQFFTVANFEKIMTVRRVKNIILLIDEVQKIFPLGYKDKDVIFFFQYHRHLGVDILMGAQDHLDVCRSLVSLSECIYQAAPRSKGIAGVFRYSVTDRKGKAMRTQTLRKKQTVFRAYKSFSSDEATKPKNMISHWAVVCVVFLVVAITLFKSAIAAVKSKSLAPKSQDSEMMKASNNKVVVPALAPVLPDPAHALPLQSENVVPAPKLPGQSDFYQRGFLPSDSSGVPVRSAVPAVQSQVSSARLTLYKNDAVPQSPEERFLNEKKSSLRIMYLWKTNNDSGMTDDINNIPRGATFKRFRATW